MDQHPQVAAAMPKILSYDHTSHFEYAGAAGGYIDRFGFPFCRGRILSNIEEDHGQYDAPIEIFWASGACMFVRSAAYHEAGGLDADFLRTWKKSISAGGLNDWVIRYLPFRFLRCIM